MTQHAEAATQLKATYEQQGWCRLRHQLTDKEVAKLRAGIERHAGERRPEVVYEGGTQAVRAIHGCHRYDEVCADLTRLPQLVDVAEDFLGSPAYVYQFKVNFKQPKAGAAWPWHQDFVYWKLEDSMPEPRAVNIAILLDDAHERNGPLMLIPGSHQLGLLSTPARLENDPEDWRVLFTETLPYTVPSEIAARLVRERGTSLLVGPAGTMFAFHPNILHSSASNLSADRRALLIITYNAVDNAPLRSERPEFLVDRDTSPTRRLGRETL